ncbi:AI-2E family transporter [Halarchaeum grantii]|uniref:AI-2E family transporter n=1 Tax=Halarchaeum grantii TaxID=1193105 RepID=A0A830F7I7_9EURY|nr:AI-2E family transporter [Halarchaeum grantii]GGL27000.1 AI-2E family transporter [Halarchaeum grantii]
MSLADWVPERRERVLLWAVVLTLAGFVAHVFATVAGTITFGLFIYYGVRPIHRRLERAVSPGVAALLTLLLVALPFFAVTGYLGLMGFQELRPRIRVYSEVLRPYVNVDALLQQPVTELVAALRDPERYSLGLFLERARHYLGLLSSAAMHLVFATLIAFYLLRDGARVREWFAGVAGADSATFAYVTAVDRDLEPLYFGSVLIVFVIALGAVVVYHAYNLLAPPALAIPFPTALALATGLASVVPLVVGKLVYGPLVGYLTYSALQAPDASLAYPLALLAVCFVFLDFVPMTFVLPEIAGRDTHVGLVMFGFIVGSMVFGWYGLFAGPLLVVLCVQAVRLLVVPLARGERVTGDVDTAEDLGSDPP